MPDDDKIIGGGQPANPPSGKEQQPAQGSQPPKEQEPTANPQAGNLEERFKALEAKVERYKDQVKGSSEEALRLKEENDKLRKDLESAKAGSATDKSFESLIEEHGLAKAVDMRLNEKLSKIETTINGLLNKDAQKVYDDFKANHKGLQNAEVLAQFDQEFNKLKDVYSSVNEALEKAYVLAGGKDAETVVGSKPEKTEEQRIAEEKLAQGQSGGATDKRTPTTKPSSVEELQQTINDLEYQAHLASSQGYDRRAIALLTQADELRGRLATKVS
jgi:hypothetical protein